MHIFKKRNNDGTYDFPFAIEIKDLIFEKGNEKKWNQYSNRN